MSNEYDENEIIMVGEAHWHEAMDKTIMFANIIEQYLYSLPFVRVVPEIKEQIGKAVEILNDAYMMIGGYEFTNGEIPYDMENDNME